MNIERLMNITCKSFLFIYSCITITTRSHDSYRNTSRVANIRITKQFQKTKPISFRHLNIR